ncbi:hypothetical protein SPI_05433 [Niveomyces insectorum RCEF 264]|uniref:Metalloprotease m41 n=1 Tax=Niveomyces insectorum RCEF 264 TaxID=1081102 RepID=A0A167T7W3_9HYPO|nr:hypothetical protein SPI_05433 [Niveomyces insectorum RCEF 264]
MDPTDPADKIAELTRIIEEQKRQQRKDHRQLEAAREHARNEQRRREAAEEIARLERQRRIDAERDAAAAAVAHQRELEENNRMQLNQTLQAYLADIHRLNFVAARLAPAAPSSIRTLSDSRKSKSTTDGRTNIFGKYYPLAMRPWPALFDDCQAAFRRIETALAEVQSFPSALAMQSQEEDLKQRIPAEFLKSEAFLNEPRTHLFLDYALQMPAQRVMNAYLATISDGPQKKLLIDNATAGWHTQVASDSAAEGRDGAEGDGVSVGAAQSTILAAASLPVKTRPDCLVLCANVLSVDLAEAETVVDGGEDNNELEQELGTGQVHRVYRIAVGEHKALHRLRTAVVTRFLQGPIEEDFMLRLAKSTKTGSTTQDAAQNTATEATLGANLADIPPGQVFFARALTQSFHYMIASGLEYGFMATGETLTLLKISRDDPTVLYYHTMLFPQYCRPVLDAGATNAASTAGTPLAVTTLCGLCLLAFESSAGSPRQRSINISELAPFPQLPPSLAEDPGRPSRASNPRRSPSRDGSRDRRRPRDDNDDSDNEDGSDQPRRTPHQPRRSSPLKRQRSTNDAADENVRRGYKRQRAGLPPISKPLPLNRFDPSSFFPIRPYCTQACLRGLVEGTPLDLSCPNVILHTEALRGCTGSRRTAMHAITKNELQFLLQQQLLGNAEQDCKCLSDDGFRGAIGYLFQITLTGYGYTFVAKGVENHFQKKLRHEERVYEQLAAHQGRLIPVCLGVVRLLLPYPMENCGLVTHMLLMSYTGPPIHSRAFRVLLPHKKRDVDVEAEAQRTMQQLEADGLQELDLESNGNFTWCAETGRVMKIDFDQAQLLPAIRHGTKDGASKASEPGAALKERMVVDDASYTTSGPVYDRPPASLVESLLLA